MIYQILGGFMEWFKKHAETVLVLGAIFGSFLWMNGKFNDLEKEMSSIRQEIAVMKAIMIMNGHYPKELAFKE